ncbi:MAG: hypothetical protein AB1416_13125 [Actinomycetota bacterium]
MNADRHEPLPQLLARLDAAPWALLALGIPRCPACDLLPATLHALAAARPGLAVGIGILATPQDWALRQTHLWPRGIRVARASVPALAVLRHGTLAATRQGSAPAHVLDRWLDDVIGPAEHPLPPGLTPEEEAVLAAGAPRRVQHLAIRERRGV